MFAGVDPLDAVRVVSILAGLGTMTIAALLAARLGGRPAALTAAALYAVVPPRIRSRRDRSDGALGHGAARRGSTFQLRLAERPQVVTGLLLGLTMGAALLTKETGMFGLLAARFATGL